LKQCPLRSYSQCQVFSKVLKYSLSPWHWRAVKALFVPNLSIWRMSYAVRTILTTAHGHSEFITVRTQRQLLGRRHS
jgi:hypothetical protein